MYSREQYEKAFELRKEGFTYKQITQILNLKTINTAYGWIKRNYKPQGKFLNINFNNLSAELLNRYAPLEYWKKYFETAKKLENPSLLNTNSLIVSPYQSSLTTQFV